MPSRPESVPTVPADRRPRYWIKTYGCQMNVHDSEVYAGILAEMGYEEARSATEADVILVNTCSVRERAEDKLFSELGRMRLLKERLAEDGDNGDGPREVMVGVTGCIAQQRGAEIVERSPAVDFVIGTRAIHSLPKVLQDVRCGGPQVMTEDLVEFEAPAAKRADRVKAFVTIMEGCNNYCSFCIVPATRGLEVYRNADAILDEIRGLGLRGYREVSLLGQNVNSWSDADAGMEFPDLLYAIDRMLEEEGPGGVQRVRFLTSHPKDLSPRLIEAMADCPHVADHLHLPVQSGSNRVLERMNRHYTVERYQQQIRALRRSVPDVGLSTDLIVGFPGETDEDFRATLRLVREVEYDSFFSFEYSPRPDTASLRYDDDVPADVKRDRLLELQDLGRTIQERRNSAFVGRRVDVLVDGISKMSDDDVTGRTSSNHIVNMPGPPELIGKIVPATVVGHGTHSLSGTVAGSPA